MNLWGLHKLPKDKSVHWCIHQPHPRHRGYSNQSQKYSWPSQSLQCWKGETQWANHTDKSEMVGETNTAEERAVLVKNTDEEAHLAWSWGGGWWTKALLGKEHWNQGQGQGHWLEEGKGRACEETVVPGRVWRGDLGKVSLAGAPRAGWMGRAFAGQGRNFNLVMTEPLLKQR